MYNISRSQAQKHAQDERNNAKRFRDEVNKKQKEIKKLQEEIQAEQKKSNFLRVGGLAGSILGAGPRGHADKLEQKISMLEGEMHHSLEQAKVADSEAYKWDEKAKFADE